MDAGDPEEEIPCPYNGSHMIRRKRMQYHIQACRRQHPEAKLFACSFNARHRLPKIEIPFHMQVCPDKDQHVTNVNEEDCEDLPAYNIVPDEDYEEWIASENWNMELSGNFFNLSASGGTDSYTRIREVADTSTMRQPHNVSQVLQKSLPPGAQLPGHALRAPITGSTASGGNGSSRADTPGAWGGAKGFGRGVIKAPPGQLTELPRQVGLKSSSSSGSSSANPSPRRPAARNATATSAFCLSAGTTVAPAAAEGSGTDGGIATDGWTKVAGNNGAGNVNGTGRGRGSGRGGASGMGAAVKDVAPGRYSGNTMRSQAYSASVSDDDEDSTAADCPAKEKRKLQKKLKQIEKLEQERAQGVQLNEAQWLKLSAKKSIENQLSEL